MTVPATKNGTNTIMIISAIILIIIAATSVYYRANKGADCNVNQSFYNNACYENNIYCFIENGTGKSIWEGDRYSECIVESCNEGFDNLNNKCSSETRERTITLTGNITAKAYQIGSYPKIKINDTINGVAIKMTIDFQQSYKDGRYNNYIYGGKSDGSKANPAPFGLFFFLGKGTDQGKSPYVFGYGGFFNAISNRNGGDLRNSNSLGINGVIPGNQIINGYTRTIPISDQVIFATISSERSEDHKYKRLNILDYINTNIGSEIFIGGFLSSMGKVDGWKFTEIKSIEIDYIGKKGAIEFIK